MRWLGAKTSSEDVNIEEDILFLRQTCPVEVYHQLTENIWRTAYKHHCKDREREIERDIIQSIFIQIKCSVRRFLVGDLQSKKSHDKEIAFFTMWSQREVTKSGFTKFFHNSQTQIMNIEQQENSSITAFSSFTELTVINVMMIFSQHYVPI